VGDEVLKFLVLIIFFVVAVVSSVLLYSASNVGDVMQKRNYAEDLIQIFRDGQAVNNREVIILSESVGRIFLECCKNRDQGVELLKQAGFQVHVSEKTRLEITKYNKLYNTDKEYDQFVFSTRPAYLWQTSKIGQFLRFILLFLPSKEYSVTLFINNGKIEKVFARADKTYL